MSSVNKKTPVTNVRKKVTASARAKTSVRKPRVKATAHNGSYFQHPVSTEDIIVNDTVISSTAPKDTNDAILTLLQEMSKANKDIVHRQSPTPTNKDRGLKDFIIQFINSV